MTRALAARPLAEIIPLKRAVIYLRVSTTKQAETSEDREGYSLPAQREACCRKAEQLGAAVVGTYLDRGESARTDQRPQFQAMLERIRAERDVDYVICDKLDRFARNRRDDANLLFELRMAGAELVSVKENIDATPAGQLLHAIMAGIAEFYSRNLATEALKGMTEKARQGGTPGPVPIGYLNVRRVVEGREIRTVAVDPDRAALVQWAFEAYATGQYRLRELTEELSARGLTTPARGRRREGTMSVSSINNLLKNRYYLGDVTFHGQVYPGKHQRLVTHQVFDQVQTILATNLIGEKQRSFDHYLKSTIFCARCHSRLCFTRARKRGNSYDYFFCLGRQQRRNDCTLPYLPVEQVEAAVERHWQTVRLTEDEAVVVRATLTDELAQQRATSEPEIARARRHLAQLTQERVRLGEAVVKGTIPGDLAREQHDRIDREREQAERIVAVTEDVARRIERTLELGLELLERCDELYHQALPAHRRMANQFFFESLWLDRDGVVGEKARQPWGAVRALRSGRQAAQGRRTGRRPILAGTGSKELRLVGGTGFEPVTVGL